MLKNIKENKSAQFVAGLATIWFGWVLYRDGWFHLFATEGSDGYGSAELAALGATLLASAVSFVQLIGILTLGVLSGLLPHVEEGARLLRRWISRGSQKAVQAAKDWKNSEKVEGEWNWKPLAAAVLAGLLWTGGHLNTAWDWIADHVDDVVEVLPRGESNDRPVLDERDLYLTTQETATMEENIARAFRTANGNPSVVFVYGDVKSRCFDMPTSPEQLERLINAIR